MPPFFRFFLLQCSFVALAAAASPAAVALPPPAEWKLPPVDGEFAGEFSATLLGGAPRVNWKLVVGTPAPRQRRIQVELDGVGLRVRAEADLNPMGEGAWKIGEAAINLADWFGWIAPRLLKELAGVSASGQLAVRGQGTWRGGALGGSAIAELREGRVDDPAHKIMLEGISVDVEFEDLAKRRTAPAQVFTWRRGQYDVVALGSGRIEFALAGETLRVTSSLIDVFGGELQVPSLVLDTSKLEFSVTARVVGVAVDQVLFLLPRVLSEAKGRLDGNVQLSRDSEGIQIGNGRLSLRQGETADLRLAMKPGWLTTSLPPDIVKYFPAFRKMENGEIPIRAKVLELTFTPLGDEQGRTAWVHVAGGPSDPQLTAPLDMNVDVRGPLERLVKIGADLGTDSRLKFGGAK